MAILKSIATNYGVDAEYWNIGAVQEDFKGRSISVTLFGYLNETARQSSKDPLAAVQNIAFSGDDYIPEMTRGTLYAKIKALIAFEGSEDL